jgi:integrase
LTFSYSFAVLKVKTLFLTCQKKTALYPRKLNINVFESIRLSPKSIPKSQLTIEHIKRIYDLDLKPHSTLNYCKVLFLAQSFSGLAYDDLITLKESDFDSTIEGKILLYKQRKKTGINTTQIINSQFEIIIKYYINDSKINQRTTIFPSISNQKYNAYLKLIAELAKINIPLSSHYARHAFSQFLEEAGNEDTKAEYEIMGWSRKGKMDYVYNRVPQQKLLNVTEKLNLYLNNHLYSNEFSEGSPYLATCNNKDSFCLMMLKAPLI